MPETPSVWEWLGHGLYPPALYGESGVGADYCFNHMIGCNTGVIHPYMREECPKKDKASGKPKHIV